MSFILEDKSEESNVNHDIQDQIKNPQDELCLEYFMRDCLHACLQEVLKRKGQPCHWRQKLKDGHKGQLREKLFWNHKTLS